MILISPFAQKLRNGERNAKNYPFWEELVTKIEEPIVQIWTSWEEKLVRDFRAGLSFKELSSLLKECRVWIGVDSFFQHFAWYEGKYGIVLWGRSDPNIFGHKENINLLKSRDNLRENQFDIWENVPYDPSVFHDPDTILKYIV